MSDLKDLKIEIKENESFYRIIKRLIFFFPEQEKTLIKSINNHELDDQFTDYREYMMNRDINEYLPDDILTKVDRASMYHSLEVRVPFLDHNVVEFARKLPMNQKIKNDEGKIILKKILRKYLPTRLVEKKRWVLVCHSESL